LSKKGFAAKYQFPAISLRSIPDSPSCDGKKHIASVCDRNDQNQANPATYRTSYIESQSPEKQQANADDDGV
jgi:hypothetical protein